ncbi:MAG: mannose-1-phosphate guanylyltransferase [Paludibacteraceae bacterium]|nr:mannose-1-phosphate guanylyltransferase [Paludibacteraceae bacterium]
MTKNENNYCVIMAGGIGSRFWPYSTEKRPKQFLDFFGTGKSLLQMTIDRFRPLVPIENMLVVTNVAYKQMILEQIPDIKENQVLCEPARRNTAPCIAYATAHIRALCLQRAYGWTKDECTKYEGYTKEGSMKGNASLPSYLDIDWKKPEMQANIVVAASDHLILEEEKFREAISKAFAFVSENKAICTLGMQPTRPETGYGYIQYLKPSTVSRQPSESIYPVKTFTEKPNLEMAEVFLKSGDFLWNSGIFIWNLQTISEAFRVYLPEVADKFREGELLMGTDQEEAFIEDIFPKCPNISIDYGIMEKAENVFVLPSSFGWSDLGTWGSLYELSEKSAEGNVSLHSEAHFYDAKGNIVVLEKGKKAIVQGVDDMIIAEQEGRLLVCKRAEEQRIKQFVSEL